MLPAALNPSHTWLPHWLGTDSAEIPAANAKALRAALGAHGVTARGVRLYLDYGDRLFAPLGPDWIRRHDTQHSLTSAVAWLRLLQACEMAVAPPPAFARAIVACCLPESGLDNLPVELFRAAWLGWSQASYSGQSAEDFARGELLPVVRWALHRRATEGFDHNQARRGWAWLRKAWAADCRARALPPARRDWPAVCHGAIFKGVRMIPLTSEAALEDEGEVMGHCITSYFWADDLGKRAQVFSARDPKTLARLATVALCRTNDSRWEIDDVKAHANGDAAAAVHEAARALMATINLRSARNLGVNP